MALQRVGWENGTLVEPAKVLSDNTVQPAQYEGTTPLSADNLKKMENNTEKFVNEQVGDLNSLNTTDKSSLVSAINEVNSKIKIATFSKTSNQQMNTGYQTFTLQNGSGDVDIFQNNNGVITLKKNIRILFVLINVELDNGAQFYIKFLKNGEQIQNRWTSSGWSFPFLQFAANDFIENDIIEFQVYADNTNSKIKNSKNTYITLVGIV